jgi:RsiW-degrading membrane proteinase PrsW (M82 family)
MAVQTSKATHSRRGAFTSDILAVIGVFVFVAAVVGLDAALRPDLTGAPLLLVGLLLAFVPAVLWLIFFYRQDRAEPEPVAHVAQMFILGLALAAAFGIPLTDQVFRVQDWLYRDSSTGVGLTEILGSLFVSGAIEAFVVYATVRYFIFDSPEFDERTDGVIYATSAALGYATALNLQFILSNEGAALGAGEIFVAEVALARAAFGGLLGYFLGRAKMEREPAWWLPLGLVLTAALNGLFTLLRGQLETGSISIGADVGGLPSFTGLLLSAGLAVLVAAIVYLLVKRDVDRTLAGKALPPEADRTVGDRRASWAVIATFVIMLLIGAFAWNNAVNRATAFDRDGFRGMYPYYFSDSTAEGDVLRVTDTLGTGAEFAVATQDNVDSAKAAAAQLAGARSTDYAVYKVLTSGDTTVAGRPALTQRFSYVDPGGLSAGALTVVDGIDYIVQDGSRAIIITLTSPEDSLPEVEPLFARFLNSLSF